MRLRFKLPVAFALTTLVFAGIVALVAALALRAESLDQLQNDMSLHARQFRAVLEQVAAVGSPADSAYLQRLTDEAGDAGDLRLTLIAWDGTVLGDSVADPATMENHATRPEVAQALAGNEGRERRESVTLGEEEIYVAIPLPESEAAWSDGVVRTALPSSRVDSLVAASWRVPLIVWAVLLIPTLAISYLLSRSITSPLDKLRNMTAKVASGDLTYRTGVRRKDELGDLAVSLNGMATQLKSQVGQLATEKERLGQVLTAMSEGVIVVDEVGRLLRANPAAELILRTSLEDRVGQPLVVLARAFPDRALAAKTRQAGGPITEIVELPGNRHIAVEAVGLRAGDGQQGHVLFVIRDETARLAIDRIRRDFATNVSHELKTPLAGLSLLAGTLKHAVPEDPEQAAVFVERLASEIGRLTVLTDDLLTLSRLEEPGKHIEKDFKRLDLGRLTDETVAELLHLAEAKEQSLTVDLTATPPVLGDAVSLRTLIRNLLDNAVRYTEPGGHIRVAVAPGTEGRAIRGVILTVQDDGVGIPAADQRRIFERFYRVDKARSRETGGTGLGLSIVRHVAERHGGRVDVVSTLGSGSAFTVWLPAAE